MFGVIGVAPAEGEIWESPNTATHRQGTSSPRCECLKLRQHRDLFGLNRGVLRLRLCSSASCRATIQFVCENTQMSIDSSLVKTLNSWGEHHKSLVHLCSNDFVYLAILLAVLWFTFNIIKAFPLKDGLKPFVVNYLVKGVIIFGVPIGIAVAVSELISKMYVRQRPFVAVSGVKLLVPHSADGGMPSHHMVFLAALITTVYFYEKRCAAVLTVLALGTGIARVVAGIHYPTDIIVGSVLGIAIAYVYHRILLKYVNPKLTVLD